MALHDLVHAQRFDIAIRVLFYLESVHVGVGHSYPKPSVCCPQCFSLDNNVRIWRTILLELCKVVLLRLKRDDHDTGKLFLKSKRGVSDICAGIDNNLRSDWKVKRYLSSAERLCVLEDIGGANSTGNAMTHSFGF